jgi:putative transposase
MKTATYTQLYIHVVFSPKGREALIDSTIEERIHAYIHGIIKNMGHQPYIINGMPDHIHILTGWNPSMSISDLVREIKRNSSHFINSNKLTNGKFQWQEGYGAFSYGKSQLQRVYEYIRDQKIHHQQMNFKKEFISFLDRFEIPYDEKYLFKFNDQG